MLVLGRHANQSIRIHTTDGVIEVVITTLDERQVRLGFNAPDSVTILRSEIDPSADSHVPSAKTETVPLPQQKLSFPSIKSLMRKLASRYYFQ